MILQYLNGGVFVSKKENYVFDLKEFKKKPIER
jgi:hypothetical protein